MIAPRLVGGLVAALLAGPLAAQQAVAPDSTGRLELPVAVADEVLRRLNDPAIPLHEGDTLLAAGDRHVGDLTVLDGSLSLAGTIDGDALVVNGDLILLPGATVAGDVFVVGGAVDGGESGRVGGEIVVHSEGLAYERIAGRIRQRRGPQPGLPQARDRGLSDFLVATGRSYNRVEGMPIAFGPRVETPGSNPFRLQALQIYRSESGLDPDRMGYYVRADQYLGGHREYRVGATLQSVIEPIEEWQISDLESGLATFIIHRDYRDHYLREGLAVFAGWEPRGSPYLLQVEGRWERNTSRAARSPLSLLRAGEEWRLQPIIAEGRLGSVVLSGAYDSRGSAWDPASGWLVRAQVEQAIRMDLDYPEVVAADAEEALLAVERPNYGRFLTGLLDMRSYNRINAQSRLNLRLMTGGSLTGAPLPPQRQHALGGEGSLAGYPLFALDCGARSSVVTRLPDDDDASDARFFPHYGCDAFALLQAEIRGKLAFRFRWDSPAREDRDSDRVWDFGWDMAPDWALFVDAGRGWTFHDRPDEPTRVNVGGGILLERLGVYFAVPVSGGSGIDFFVRLGPRF